MCGSVKEKNVQLKWCESTMRKVCTSEKFNAIVQLNLRTNDDCKFTKQLRRISKSAIPMRNLLIHLFRKLHTRKRKNLIEFIETTWFDWVWIKDENFSLFNRFIVKTFYEINGINLLQLADFSLWEWIQVANDALNVFLWTSLDDCCNSTPMNLLFSHTNWPICMDSSSSTHTHFDALFCNVFLLKLYWELHTLYTASTHNSLHQ